MADETRTRINCPVDNCDGFADNHEDPDITKQLHTQPGREWPEPSSVEWPLEIQLWIGEATWPHWRLNIDTWHTEGECTPLQAGYMAAEINLNVFYVLDLNEAIDGVRS
jgi:hypothetical protein